MRNKISRLAEIGCDAFEVELLEERIYVGREDREGRGTDVISSFSRFVNMVSPRPPPIEVRISTF